MPWEPVAQAVVVAVAESLSFRRRLELEVRLMRVPGKTILY
jgi:hypothetical protein